MDKDKDDREKPAKRVVRKEVAIVLPAWLVWLLV
jgi:hypothetical protein